MPTPCYRRLTVVGGKRGIQAFVQSNRWPKGFGARYIEPLELFPSRRVWQFESDRPPLEPMAAMSRRHPFLVFLLEYDQPPRRIKGLAKAKNGRLEHHQVRH